MKHPFDLDFLGLVPRPFKLSADGHECHRIDDDGVRARLVVDPRELQLPEDTPAWQAAEAYRLSVAGGRCHILAGGELGMIHARRVLDQLRRAGAVPDLTIVDRPEHRWRGLSVDVARHFFGPRDLVAILEIMGSLRLNRLHLHLSDDQGWRIEIPALPELEEKGSVTSVGGAGGGHLSLADMAHLMDEAERRGIVIVPEVDIPGHTTAALHALVGLNLDGVAPPIHEGMEVGISSLSVAAPQTEQFLTAVADTLAPLGRCGVHIGGDECLLTPPDEYAQLVGMMVRRVHERGRRVIAWQEAAPHLEKGDLLQVWDERQSLDEVRAAARAGVGIIASPGSRAYLDMKLDESDRLGLTWAGTTTLRRSYEWEPEATLPGVAPESIWGVEACIFTETIDTFEDLVLMLLPRLAAIAEVAWSGGGVGCWESFAHRIAVRAREWEALGHVWYRSPEVRWDL